MLGRVAAEQARLGKERHVREPARGLPGPEERRHTVASGRIADGHTGLPGKGAQHQLAVPLLGA
jgi:hypothetical protein